MTKSHLDEDELADIMAMFPKVDFGYDQDGQLSSTLVAIWKTTPIQRRQRHDLYQRRN